MNGAEAIIDTLGAAGATICFANPGTSELHLVQALDRSPQIRGVACLFEGVATGAADGFGRMTGTPALALLHQGPGLANGLANMHNARRAGTPLIAIVGASATDHVALDAPLETDVATLARPMSTWVGVARTAGCAASAWQAALSAPRGPVTLVVPADVAWAQSCDGAWPHPADVAWSEPAGAAGTGGVRPGMAGQLWRAGTLLLLGGTALTERGQAAANRIAQATGCTVLTESFPARQRRGRGTPLLRRLSPDAGQARRQLAGADLLILAGATPPVAAFGEPGVPGGLWPPGCAIEPLLDAGHDIESALEDLADTVAAGRPRPAAHRDAPAEPPDQPLTPDSLARVIAALLPADAIVVEEANSLGGPLTDELADAEAHDLLTLRGFAIGQGIPLATGAALACPQRPVLCLEADGSALYTTSGLWTQAREGLDVTTVVLDNGAYATLQRESHRRLGAEAAASALFELRDPGLDFAALSTGFGVPASRAESTGQLAEQLRAGFTEPGPHLIQAVVRSAER